MTITREQAIEIAKTNAAKNGGNHAYIPFASDVQEWAEWMPHEWVIAAIIEASQPIADVQAEPNASAEAIKFALEDEDGLDFLRYWNEGDFDTCRRLWPDAPLAVYLGADPLFATVAHRQQQAEGVKAKFEDGFLVEWSGSIEDGEYILQAAAKGGE